jgi:hypothetical protein
MIDRSEINRALAKAIAYKECGKQAEAEVWAAILVAQLECLDILKPETAAPANTLARSYRPLPSGRRY